MKLLEIVQLPISKYSKGEILFHEGDVCNSVGIISKGNIRIHSYSFSGHELVFNDLGPGQVFGNNLIFASDHHYKGDVEATNDVEVMIISKSELIRLLQSNTMFLKAYLKVQSDFGKALNQQIKLLSFTNMEERFMFYLFSHHNKIEYQSVTDLDLQLHIERETLSRLLTKLEKRHRIRRLNHLIEAMN